ncbi:ankyrin repeat-containing protein NPR4-like isoform X2 [Corylus avellana]|uniref:ankyrin repeat-containing protein NPR4-like isoform X2 n=1 Tax=Corylus avellana TaxID=13451 RepID=UPI00286BED3C|nr:ankyrin repeat-containing protein NPR4-like isoform X2 [Corylus avellana]
MKILKVLKAKIPGAQKKLDEYRTLRQAASKGDWRAAKKFYETRNDCVRASIKTDKATALHVAVAYQQTAFIKKWLNLRTLKQADLELKTNYGFTALHTAAQVGNVSIAEQLVKKNDNLPSITNDDGDTPLIVAAYVGHTNMVSYLFSLISTHPKQLTQEKCIELLRHTIRNDMYDIALKILNKYSDIANADTKWKWEALETLANKPFKLGSESQLSFWKSLLKYSCFKGIYNKAFMKASAHQLLVERLLRKDGNPDALILSKFAQNDMALIFEAATAGNVEFLIIIARSYPDVIWELDKNDMSIIHTAILHRQESVFNLIYEIGTDIYSLASYFNKDNEETMLHLAGKLAPSDRLNIVSGAALQMQRELLWFKEIEKIVPQSYLKRKNLGKKTPKEIFVEAHNDLQKKGEEWMKSTANYCMVVATLIATVMFTTAFTVPGGNVENKGTPIFLRRNWFMVFFISDAIALCSSSTSIVFFLSILTSRYREDDFLKALPLKLLFGLATLFVAMTGMLVAFIANFFLVYTSARTWTLFVVSIPIILFGWLHREIWVDTFSSSFMIGFLFRPHKHGLL